METLSRMMMETTDLNLERLAKLKEFFPDLFTVEGKLNEDELKKLTETDGAKETERYDFRWFGKSQSKRNAFTPTNTTLVFNEARSVNPKVSENIIVEGENLEVLKLLLCSYREKIKCIYIDPPYNTGNDFVYSDNYTEQKRPYWEKTGAIVDGVKQTTNPDTSGRYHSDWLNMMYSRLLVARSLLKSDGVVFISIDDNEVHNLRKLCDEVFGEENFVATFPWRKRTAKSDVPFAISQDFEWIICFAKENFLAGKEITRKYFFTEDVKKNWRLADITKQATKEERPKSFFTMVNPKNGKEYPANPNRVWSITEDTFEDYYKKGKIVFPDDYDFLGGSIPSFRVFEEEDKAKSLKKFGIEEAVSAISTLLPKEIGRTEDGNREIINLFGNKIFSFAKPSSLIKYLIRIVNDKNALIIDFFGGSGVTGQAVMELNKEDEGNRKFILVQLPELIDEKHDGYKAGYKKISDITIERNKRVVKKIIAEKEAEHPNLFAENKDALKGLGFKVFQLVKSNFPRAEFKPDANKTDEENLQALKKYIEEKERQQTFKFNIEDLMTEILLKQGFTLNFTYAPKPEFTHNHVFHAADGEKETLICLDEDIKLETIEQLKQTEQKFICLERALDTTKKWNLNHYIGDKFQAF